MRLARGAGLDQQVALTAQAGLHQVLVHGAGHEQRMRGDAALHQVAVREQQHQLALAHRALRLRAHAPDRVLQALRRVVLQVEKFVRDRLDGQDLPQLPLRENRRAEHHLAGVFRRGQENVALRADLGLQRHHDALAQRIDRRVGHLRKLLAEVVVQRAHLVRQHRHGSVVAHRAHRLVLVLRQHADDVVTLLLRDVEHLLVEREGAAVHRLGGEARVHQVALEVAHAGLQPGLVGMPRLENLVDVRSRQQGAAVQVECDHVPRPQLALPHHLLGLVVPHAGLGGDRQPSVAGDAEARRPQSVAIEHTQRVAAVGQHHSGRAIPGLHVHRVIFVEGAQVRVEGVEAVPGRRDQQPHGVQRIEPTHQQHLEHVVEALRVRAVQGHQRQYLLQLRQQR